MCCACRAGCERSCISSHPCPYSLYQVIDLLEGGSQSIATADGSKYVGGWKEGKMHGEGELRSPDGTYFKGITQSHF